MYHEVLGPGLAPARHGAGYARYVIEERSLREHLDLLRSTGLPGRDVSAMLASTEPGVALTFDDGCASDLLIAAPLLVEHGHGATFYVTVAHLGQPGFLTEPQLRELSRAGFEIGSHSLTHAYLSDLDDAALHRELAESKDGLEQITGVAIRHLSCPGGRWSPRVASAARSLGYASVADSRPRANSRETDVFRLGRFAITRQTSADDVLRICREGRLPGLRMRALVLGAARSVLGNRLYDRARRLILEPVDD